MTWLILGTLVGGRLGFMLLYDLGDFLRAPWSFFEVWHGGMASHGGFAGVVLAALFFARRNSIPFPRLADILVPLTPPGLMLGRIANFINGELWGKVSQVPWAVIFPASAQPGTPVHLIQPRHPSQLYEAFLEGFVLLLFSQLRFWRSDIVQRQPGRLSGEFLVAYALLRILGELFREPDAALILGVSRGIFYSVLMGLVGLYVLWRTAWRPAARARTGGEGSGEKKR
jgi:phosphatidylglycerol:prolipoprotein diacylglycerol transferase